MKRDSEPMINRERESELRVAEFSGSAVRMKCNGK